MTDTAVLRVLDTNIVLDLWVFDEPRAEALRLSVEAGHTHWLATAAMRDELARTGLPADRQAAHCPRPACRRCAGAL